MILSIKLKFLLITMQSSQGKFSITVVDEVLVIVQKLGGNWPSQYACCVSYLPWVLTFFVKPLIMSGPPVLNATMQ